MEKKAIHSLTLYHGTSANLIPSIVNNGLLAKRPAAFGAVKAIYLTGDVETAAYYAGYRNQSKPIVLEVTVSDKKRIGKIQQDSLDREGGEDEDEWSEEVRSLENTISDIIESKRYSLPYEFSWIKDEPESIRGNNIYKSILQWGRNNSKDIDLLKRRMFKILPPGEHGIFDIHQDGSIGLNESFYSGAHQVTYPKNLPAVSIKAVWIPESCLSPGVPFNKKKKIGKRLIVGNIEEINETIRDLQGWSFTPTGFDTVEDMKEAVKDKVEGIYPEFFNPILQSIESAETKEEISNTLYSIEPVFPGELKLQPEEWYRIPVSSNESLLSVPSLYKRAGRYDRLFKLADRFYRSTEA